MTLGTLSLSVTRGVQGRPFAAKINGLTTGRVEILSDGAPGFSSSNAMLRSESLPYPVSTAVIREYDPGGSPSFKDTRLEINATTAIELVTLAAAAVAGGRILVRSSAGATRQVDGSLAWSGYAEDDYGATTTFSLSGGTPTPTPTPTPVPSPSAAPTLSAVDAERTSSLLTLPPTIAVQTKPDHLQGYNLRVVAALDADFLFTSPTVNVLVPIQPTGMAAAIQAALNGISAPSRVIFQVEGGGKVGQRTLPMVVGANVMPNMTSPSAFSVNEESVLAQSGTFDRPVTLWIAGQDQGMVELVGVIQPGQLFPFRFKNDGVQDFDAPADWNQDNVIDFDFVVDPGTGVETTFPITVTVLDVDTVPDDFTLTAISNAPLDSDVETAEYTVSGLGTGYAMPVTMTNMQLKKKPAGGSYGAYSGAATTLANGDKFVLKRHSSPSYSTQLSATLNYGPLTKTLYVTTLNDPAQPSIVESASPFTATFMDYVTDPVSLGTFTFGAGQIVIALRGIRSYSSITAGGVPLTLVAGVGNLQVWANFTMRAGASREVIATPTGGSANTITCKAYTGSNLAAIVSGSLQSRGVAYGNSTETFGPMTISGTTGPGFVMVEMSVGLDSYAWTGANGFTDATQDDPNSGTLNHMLTGAVPASATPSVTVMWSSGYPTSSILGFVFGKAP